MRITAFVIICLLCISGIAGFVDVNFTEALSSGGNLPEILRFEVNPANIKAGDRAVLSWQVKNANSVIINQDIGAVSSRGNLEVSPSYTTTFQITAINEVGIRERYITLTVHMIKAESETVGCDPVTGRNSQIDLRWEDYCYSSQYQVQIARDPAFTLVVYDSGVMAPADTTSPAFWYPPGVLEAGHTYYWRVRARGAVTGQSVLSPWSEARPITVQSGFAVRAEHQGIQALSPANGCYGCPVKPVSFSWTGYPGTTKYRFILARDSQLQNIVVEAFTSTTSYELSGSLEYSTSYFWQVQAIEPIPSDPSPTFTFFTESAPPVPLPKNALPSQDTPIWAWVVIAISSALAVMVLVFIIFAGKSRKI